MSSQIRDFPHNQKDLDSSTKKKKGFGLCIRKAERSVDGSLTQVVFSKRVTNRLIVSTSGNGSPLAHVPLAFSGAQPRSSSSSRKGFLVFSHSSV